ncbi:hypothetical protein AMECASPLE_007318 [Ameca splendens]|uniref:Uncharacterized protein n=1 Tax=Ameca splendens TaxID=208324 RepID=A0ABV0XNX8_9TELE
MPVVTLEEMQKAAASVEESADYKTSFYGRKVLPIFFLLEVYKKAGLSALQCLSVNLHVLAPSSCVSLLLASSFSQPLSKVNRAKPSRIDLDQVPADSPSPSTPKDLRQANPAHPQPLTLHQVSRNYTR